MQTRHPERPGSNTLAIAVWGRTPPAAALADAQARVAELPADGASFVSTDWNTVPANAMLGDVLLRG